MATAVNAHLLNLFRHSDTSEAALYDKRQVLNGWDSDKLVELATGFLEDIKGFLGDNGLSLPEAAGAQVMHVSGLPTADALADAYTAAEL